VVKVIKVFQKGQKEDIALMGLPGTAHQTAAEEAGVKFIAGWFFHRLLAWRQLG
jgi:hypothetical protein